MEKPTKKQIIAAAKKAIKHWGGNVESYPLKGSKPVDGSDYERGAWFDMNCKSEDCALCELLTEVSTAICYCEWCPLGPHMCCSQWETLNQHILYGTSTKKHVEAVLNKLINELEKLLPPLD